MTAPQKRTCDAECGAVGLPGNACQLCSSEHRRAIHAASWTPATFSFSTWPAAPGLAASSWTLQSECPVSHDCDHSLILKEHSHLDNRRCFKNMLFHVILDHNLELQRLKSAVVLVVTLCCKQVYRLQPRRETSGWALCYKSSETTGDTCRSSRPFAPALQSFG